MRIQQIVVATLAACFMAGCKPLQRDFTLEDTPRSSPDTLALVYEQSFDGLGSMGDFVFSDAAAWRFISLAGDGCLEQYAASDYSPPHRSPLNLGLLRAPAVGSFILETDLMQTGRDYAHRDMCFVFGFRDASHYFYAHLSRDADANAHNVFVVDDAPRTPITTSRTEGVDWGTDQWRRLRVEFDSSSSTVRVFFDGEEVMMSDQVGWSGGYIGFGSFDDEGRVDNIRLWGDVAMELEDASFGG